jgi:hypothetical protein
MKSGFTLSFISATNADVRAAAWWVSLRSLPSKRAAGPK